MPAISPARLRADTADLQKAFQDPDGFIPALTRTLEHYADRTVRAGQSGRPAPLAPMYHTPRPVLRAIENALASPVRAAPDRALDIADRLWQNPVYEVRQVAIALLGLLPASCLDEVLERLSTWPQQEVDEGLLAELFAVPVSDPHKLYALFSGWLESGAPDTTSLGLIALEVVVSGDRTLDLPAIFRSLSPLLSQSPPRHKPRLSAILRILAETAPQETAYFLRQLYINAQQPEIARIIRQNLDQFPPEIRQKLQESLRREL